MTEQPPFKAACIELCTGREMAENLADIERKINAACAAGAQFIVLPETCNIMGKHRAEIRDALESDMAQQFLPKLQMLAKAQNIYLQAGSLQVIYDHTHFANRAYLITPQGEITALYDKIHLFDVSLPNGEQHHESERFRAGETAIVTDIAWGKLGLSVCYDLRFAALYRDLAQAGADFITIPSAFTKLTGQAHWHILVRARAIETGCFIFAAAQGGRHENGRETFGHSLIVDPWGQILAEAKAGDEFIIAEIDPKMVQNARRAIPSLTHDRPFQVSL